MEAVIVDYSQWCPYVFLKGSVHNHALTPIKTESKNNANPMPHGMGDLFSSLGPRA